VIFGIGTDIVAINRIEEGLAKHRDRFLHRILSDAELAEYAKHNSSANTQAAARFVAKRFAAKEAFSKAFGTGIGEAVGWHDVRVTHDTNGKPLIAVSPALQIRLDAAGINRTHISISDEQDHAIAFVVLES
jgi:holo-[acyl-carrier protein] synthase